jgi:hypothetical protein
VAMRRGGRIAVLVVFAVVMTALWCVGYVVWLSALNRNNLRADLPAFIGTAVGLSGPIALAAMAGWWVSTRRAPLAGVRAGAWRGAVAALLTALFLTVTVGLTSYMIAALTPAPPMQVDPRLIVGPIMVAAFLLGSPLGWVGVPLIVAMGALYGAMVHRAIGSPDGGRGGRVSTPNDALLAP